jgi:hypothetical protein
LRKVEEQLFRHIKEEMRKVGNKGSRGGSRSRKENGKRKALEHPDGTGY